MLIFVQVCRTINKNLSVFKSSINYEEQMRATKFTKRKLCCKKASEEESVWRKYHLKKRASEDHQKLFTKSWRHQKLKSSEAAEDIRSWSSTESEDWSQEFVISCYSKDIWLQKEWKLGATAISEELEDIECLSTEERIKRT